MSATFDDALPLAGKDIRDHLDVLCQSLARFFRFTGRDLFFPPSWSGIQAEHIEAEQTLMLPLSWQGRLVAALKITGVEKPEMERIWPLLDAVVQLSLENTARAARCATDASTGLAAEGVLYARLAERAGEVREAFGAPHQAGDLKACAELRRLCASICVLRLANAAEMQEKDGWAAMEKCFAGLAQALLQWLPGDVLAARAGRRDIALLLPGVAGRLACQKLAEGAVACMREAAQAKPLAQTVSVRPVICAGHAVFPQDMAGPGLRLAPEDLGRELLERARLAASTAEGRGQGCVMPFAAMLQRGGVVLKAMGMGRVLISLGSLCKASEGMGFAFYDRADGRLKGELAVLQVRRRDSVCEVVHLADPAFRPEPGDVLELEGVAPAQAREPASGALAEGFPESSAPLAPAAGPDGAGDAVASADSASSARAGEAAGAAGAEAVRDEAQAAAAVCLSHAEFKARMDQIVAGREPFALAMLRLEAGTADPDACGRFLEGAAALWFAKLAEPGAFAGFYGINGLAFCHVAPQGDLEERYRELCRELGEHGLDCAVGIASWPFLAMGRGEMTSCVLKALEYAQLLPEPKVGTFCSQAITISADRLYSMGDAFRAVDEYKLALLADPDNAIALNSLGVCMATLGRHEVARRYFLRSLEAGGDGGAEKAQALYNLGTVCQQLGDLDEARSRFKACLEADPGHVFALVRLGQLEEREGRMEEALAFFEKAALAESRAGGEGKGGSSLALRCLARLAASQSRQLDARQILAEALRKNPDDASAMLMLAELYLKERNAADIAEILARHSLSIKAQPRAWKALAGALRAQGREAEAAMAELKA
ncbi:MAG: tetratricopeptide repeat protein [Desulfovibrio sp.]|nr:tetratricopeptide repeat protein [Desulfovibrio sp.]